MKMMAHIAVSAALVLLLLCAQTADAQGTLSCYTVTTTGYAAGAAAVSLPQAIAQPAGTFNGCSKYAVVGTFVKTGSPTLTVSGYSGEGLAGVLTCANPGATNTTAGNPTVNALAALALVSGYTSVSTTISGWTCCTTNNCNAGLNILISGASPLSVSVAMLLAAVISSSALLLVAF